MQMLWNNAWLIISEYLFKGNDINIEFTMEEGDWSYSNLSYFDLIIYSCVCNESISNLSPFFLGKI